MPFYFGFKIYLKAQMKSHFCWYWYANRETLSVKIYAYDVTNRADLSTIMKGWINSPIFKSVGKIPVGNLKIFKAFLVLVLLSGIFANNMMAETCFCGEGCSHDFKNNLKEKSHLPFHNHCVGTHCKSCNLEDGQTLKAVHSSSPGSNLKLLDTTLLKFTLSADHLDSHVIRDFTPDIYAFEKVQSLPVYLNNCSLLR